MKPSQRFQKKVWRKPPKQKSKQHKIPNKIGKAKCAVCKKPINSAKRNLARENFKRAKSSVRTNRPYGNYLCTTCLRKLAIKETRALQTD
ncbi:MAG: 50S ribosomal protein L34e [Candidatus Heimdallarchaeota archaeon]|nr:50S ribosomal protein L34e [Candidatus Heimdallarchaeota archaeon]